MDERKEELEMEVKTLKRKLTEKEEELGSSKSKINKQEHLLNQLKDRIECPVCLYIPRSGPVPVCPKGHLVCKKCKKDSCPTCRTAMGSGMSLLAATVLENIEHECEFEDCDEHYPLEDLGKHEKNCPHRIVNCPKSNCQEKVSLANLMDHLKNSAQCCMNKKAPRKTLTNWNRRDYNIIRMDAREGHWQTQIYSFSSETFVVFPMKKNGLFYFVIVMFASETECSKYKFEMTVDSYDEEVLVDSFDAEVPVKFQGSPLSIDLKKEELKFYCISELLMAKILSKSMSKSSFRISFKMFKRDTGNTM
eukprot:GFUD01023723.1.p1 GENE.GFUD01023723.1~~GFUD01023723.1.p1  ORF type:complete len:306 (-),score=53.87 GFUD01023723.1:86-1003(-)